MRSARTRIRRTTASVVWPHRLMDQYEAAASSEATTAALDDSVLEYDAAALQCRPPSAVTRQEPAFGDEATEVRDGLELALSPISNTGYKWVSFRTDRDSVNKYVATWRAGSGNKRFSLGSYRTAVEAAMAVAKYKKSEQAAPAGAKRTLWDDTSHDEDGTQGRKKQRAAPSLEAVTCSVVATDAHDQGNDAACHRATRRLLQTAKPWHVQALLADFGLGTEGAPAELARRLARALTSCSSDHGSVQPAASCATDPL